MRFDLLKNRRFKRGGIAVGLLLAVYTVVGFFVVPWILGSRVLPQTAETIGRSVTARDIKFNPFTLSLTVNGLSINEPDGSPMLGFEQLFVNFQASSVVRFAFVFAEIRLDGPWINFVIDEAGKVNLAGLVPPADPAKEAEVAEKAGIPAILIYLLRVGEGRLDFKDFAVSTPFETTLSPISFSIDQFTTEPTRNSPFEFAASFGDGAQVKWGGDFSVQPLRAKGEIRIDQVSLRTWWTYVQDLLAFEITEGSVNISLAYDIGRTDDTFQAEVSAAHLTLTQLALGEKGAQHPLISLASAAVADSRFSLQERKIDIGPVRLDALRVTADRSAAGEVNLQRLFTGRTGSAGASDPADPSATENNEAASSPWRIAVPSVVLENSDLSFQDNPPAGPVMLRLSPLNIEMSGYENTPAARFGIALSSGVNETGTLRITGQMGVSPFAVEADLGLENLALLPFAPYLKPVTPVRLETGHAGIKGHITCLTDEKEGLSVRFAGGLDIGDVAIADPDQGQTVLGWKALSVEDSRFDLSEKRIDLGKIHLEALKVAAERNATGEVNLQTLFAGKSQENGAIQPAAQDGPAGASPWQVRLPLAAVRNADIAFSDNSPAEPVMIRLTPLDIDVSDYDNKAGTVFGASLVSGVNEKGKIRLAGKMGLSPLQMTLDIDLDGLALPDFEPYLKPAAQVALNRGTAGAKGRLSYKDRAEGAPEIRFTGRVGIDQLSVEDPVHGEPVLGWKTLLLDKVAVQTGPTRIKIGRVNLDHLKAAFSLYPEGETTLTTLFPQEKSPAPGKAEQTEKTDAVSVVIDALHLTDNALAFADRSISPHFVIGVQALNGTATAIGTAPEFTADLDFKGKIDGLSPLEVKGRFQPSGNPPQIDIALDSRNIEMTRMTPYFGKYVGNIVQKGKLFLELKYTVADKKLKGENHLLLDQFSLGTKTGSPDATSLPVGLAIALLKDRSGKIDIHLPVQGDLSDPNYRYGSLVLKAITNLIAKAATSPFSLLGSLVGGSGEALRTVGFEFGETLMPAGEMEKLDKIAIILSDRPGLGLEIKGAAHPEKDRQKLAEKKLESMLVRMKTKGKAPAEPLTPEERAAFIRKAHHAKFPDAKPVDGKTPEETLHDQTAQLLSAVTVTDDELRALATARAGNIKTHLVSEGKISDDRLFLVDIALAASPPESAGANAELSLVGK